MMSHRGDQESPRSPRDHFEYETKGHLSCIYVNELVINKCALTPIFLFCVVFYIPKLAYVFSILFMPEWDLYKVYKKDKMHKMDKKGF